MKRLFICMIPFALLIGLGVYSAPAGNVIRIYATGGDIRPMVAGINAQIANKGLTLALVGSRSAADIEVKFVDVSHGASAAVAYPYDGRIEIERGLDATANTLLHEMLHCAGVGHEDDSKSVMFSAAGPDRRLKPQHVEALRRLSGITWPGRLIAQFRAGF